jgi:sugar phosphate isomerase/epimerase
MLGIYDWFGYDVSISDRYKFIKEAGFDNVMLWWSEGFGRGIDYQKSVQYARNEGLFIENIHTPLQGQNNFSLDNLDGENVFQCYLQCIIDCSKFDIPSMVIHLPNDKYPINKLGMDRVELIRNKAEEYDVNVAFENLGNISNLTHVLDTINSKKIGFCYDCCHHTNYARKDDLLGKYGDRLMAIHLHDNGGEKNQHQLPFDGNIDWSLVMEKIVLTGYKGATTLEPMNWGYENLSILEFLSSAYKKVKKLDDLRTI